MTRFVERESGLLVPENYEPPWSRRHHYAGSATCRGMISGGFDPTKLSGLEAFFLAHQGWSASQWNDLSGKGNHLTQGNATQQPTLSTGWSGGLPAVQFDGSNDSMFRSTLASGTIAQQTTMVAVIETAGASLRGIADSRDGSNRQLVVDDGTFVGHFGGAAYCAAVRTFSAPEKAVYVGVFDGTNSTTRFRRNGLSVITNTSNTGTMAINGLTLGNAFNDGAAFGGKIAAFCLYRRALTAAEQLQIESYFLALYRMT